MKPSPQTPPPIPDPQEPTRAAARAALESPEELLRKFPRRAVLLPGGSPQQLAQMKRLRANGT